MNIIEPKVELCKEEGLKKIELIGKVCTKKESTIKENTAETFVLNRIKEGHCAIIEHEYVYFDISKVTISETIDLIINNKYIKLSSCGNFIAINYRSLVDLYIQCIIKNKFHTFTKSSIDLIHNINILWYHTDKFSKLFFKDISILNNDGIEYINRISLDECLNKCPEIYCVTFKFTTDRGITHELVRHRDFSFMQESTRWCNYSKESHGSSINVIEPGDHSLIYNDELGTSTLEGDIWKDIIADVEHYYIKLTKTWPAQIARSVLPNATKSDIYMTGSLKEWTGEFIDEYIGDIHIKEAKGFLPLRDSKNAHPQMIPLAQEVKRIIKNEFNYE